VNRQMWSGISNMWLFLAPYNQITWHSARAMYYIAVYSGKMQVWLDIAVIGPLQPNNSVTVPVANEVSTYHLYKTTYFGKNDQVTDDVKWPRKVKTQWPRNIWASISARNRYPGSREFLLPGCCPLNIDIYTANLM